MGKKKVHPERQTFVGEIRRRKQRNHALLVVWHDIVPSGEILSYEIISKFHKRNSLIAEESVITQQEKQVPRAHN